MREQSPNALGLQFVTMLELLIVFDFGFMFARVAFRYDSRFVSWLLR
jgi:hypothetical protein